MKKSLLIAISLLLLTGLTAQVLTCREIQETDKPNGDSEYAGQTVTVQGIVVAEKFWSGNNENYVGYMISDPEGGPWSGLYIFDNRNNPSRGDLVQVTGTVTEYYNFTELTSVSNFQILSSNNPLPQPTVITTDQLTGSNGEQWESVLVQVQDVTVTATPDNRNEFYVNNSTAACQVDDQCFRPGTFTWPTMTVGQNIASIQGVVDYAFSEFGLNPRSLQDVIFQDDVANSIISIPVINAELGNLVDVPVNTTRLKPNWYVSSYKAEISIDNTKILFQGIKTDDTTITPVNPDFTLSASGDKITIEYLSQEPISSSENNLPLFYLTFETIDYGEAFINIDSFRYDNTDILSIFGGKILSKIAKNIAHLSIGTDTGSKNIFDPSMNEKINIEYGCKSGPTGINTRALVRIYDSQGRLVATPVNTNISSSLGIEKIAWDGRDNNMRLLPVGLYYCHLELIDRAGGGTLKTVQPIVIKSKLK
ncbi:MAG TPA: hypothetical protein GX398_00905 [Candidatus Cloacimonetes bacterium]|jgi:hypothetical protein|nr:hypothetical protein [Candidatus Cloacimonas sp.]HHZ14661.1 hypothetical protein [Candidatus Cloacimonadota bacterium]